MKRPPSLVTTAHSASMNTHFNPNQRASNNKAPEIMVNTVLNRLLNRLAYIQPVTPTSVRGGDKVSGAGLAGAAIGYLLPNWIRRLYRFPTSDQARLIAR